jgi:hypothetical protein
MGKRIVSEEIIAGKSSVAVGTRKSTVIISSCLTYLFS